jgi:glucose-6-phosphate 1-epimerase
MKQSQVVLNASRAAQKKASRTKWLEARGFSNDATVDAPAAGMMTNEGGLEYVKLIHPDTGASAEVYLFGGVVTSYKDGEGTEFIAVRPDAKMDGSKPISGGLSHCWPQVRFIVDARFVKENHFSSTFPILALTIFVFDLLVWTR